jgi:PAS domain S-box-containing protein
MEDMNVVDVVGDYREVAMRYYDGSSRTVFVTDIETPMPDGRLIVSRTDPDGIITHVNDSFVDMSGFDHQELIGAPHYILRHPDMPAAAFKDLWQTLLVEGKKWHGYVKNLHKDGGFYWVYATVIPNVRNKEVVGFTSVRRKPSRKKVEEAEELYKSLV